MKGLIERMRHHMATEGFREKPKTATTIQWTEDFFDSWRWTPEAKQFLEEEHR